MPFILIHGTFHLVSRGASGAEHGFQPDGDSLHFRPANPALLDRLTQLKRPYHLSAIGSTQLRFEGIDALELHFQGAASHQPRPLADNARDFLTGQLGLNPVPYQPPHNITVDPPVAHDAAPGYILSRSLEVNGRPVAFAFGGAPPDVDGASVFLDVPLVRQSLNHALLSAGHAYPLFYDTLFVDLRREFAAAIGAARAAGLGLWPQDVSQTGLAVTGPDDLEANGVLFPKLFRRLSEYFGEGLGGLENFPTWLTATLEQVIDLSSTNVTHFDNLVDLQDSTVRLTVLPEDVVFISAK
jgi:endonuclease YncB( thermonuclease family)